MLKLLGDFIGELRAAGIPISMSEHVDSAKAMEVIDLSDRSLVKNSLAATLVKDGDHMPVFNTAFEVFFSTRSWESVGDILGEELQNGEDGAQRNEGAAGAGPAAGGLAGNASIGPGAVAQGPAAARQAIQSPGDCLRCGRRCRCGGAGSRGGFAESQGSRRAGAS